MLKFVSSLKWLRPLFGPRSVKMGKANVIKKGQAKTLNSASQGTRAERKPSDLIEASPTK
jgi:hypothetical protein